MPLSVPITYLNLSFPEITFADNDDDEDEQESEAAADPLSPEIFSLWQTASTLVTKFNIQHLGVSEFSTARLSALIKFSEKTGCTKPAVNQINIRDCCVLPLSLVALAKNSGVKLLAHNDSFNILPVESVSDFVSLIGVNGEQEWDWDWLLKITGVIADHGVVFGQGWIVELGAVQPSRNNYIQS